MPDELPRKLPPKRAVDHEIELVLGTKPPARAPYRMTQPELVELRKQLKDMLQSSIIKLAKSPYGAPVLFQKKPIAPYVFAVLHGFLDEFVVVYLDGIVIYSRTLAEHVEHLRQVLARLREYELYAKGSKCSFAQETISFLGHIVERGRIRMDPKKVKAIEEWQPPSDVHDLCSFLGLANYYRRFVKDYSKIARKLGIGYPNVRIGDLEANGIGLHVI
ncbi:UNVERIFIED_CONTAM: Retrovirus-related Pol polyprotein from transposon gypsy [Sesamum radiatum]|uniref:Retrovirus-related Pol polyprotein from transposon gypsy n=1 Tax=Sesamum radiatum TaxID=300843 RepID=A0AAW2JF35_SESRA